MVVAAPLGGGLTGWLGAAWTLRLAFVVFAGGTVLALALSSRIDAPEDEDDGEEEDPDAAARERRRAKRARRKLGRRVVTALRANTALRAFTGFLTLFLAFRLRTAPVGGLNPGTAVAMVIAVAGVGGGVGTALGGLLRRVRPQALIAAAIAAVAVTGVWAAIGYGLWAVVAISAVAGLGTGARQAVARRARADRDAGTRAHLGVRPVGDRAAARLGRRWRRGPGAPPVRPLGPGRSRDRHRPGRHRPPGRRAPPLTHPTRWARRYAVPASGHGERRAHRVG